MKIITLWQYWILNNIFICSPRRFNRMGKLLKNIILTLFLVFNNTGVYFHFHYCKGTLSKISWNADSHPCSCHHSNSSCCRTEVKSPQTYQASQNITVFQVGFQKIYPFTNFFQKILHILNFEAVFRFFRKLWNLLFLSLYLKYCVLIV